VIFLKQVIPSLEIISVATRNLYGHPGPEALALLKNNNIRVLRTD
jgi:beta-lactamase superfamily II metal-dependent hydrolase